MTDTRYRLIAIVCEGGVVRDMLDVGFSLFQTIFERSNGCRYAVTECSDGKYRVFDLWSCTFDPLYRASHGKFRDFDDEDTAIMACVLTDHQTSNLTLYIGSI